MFKKFFKKCARKFTESDLDYLIGRFSTHEPEEIFLLHTAAASAPNFWRTMLNEDYSNFFDKLITIEQKDIDEEIQKEIAAHTQVLSQLQNQSNKLLNKFMFRFWKAIFFSMLHPELEGKGRHLTQLIQDQSDIYIDEFARRAEESVFHKAENTESLEDHTLYHTLPKYYK